MHSLRILSSAFSPERELDVLRSLHPRIPSTPHSQTNIDSTLHDRTHKGNRQAGNKSLLSFRADVGIPGYTGFIPIVNCVRVPGKNAEHTGKFASSELVNEALKDTLRNPRNESLYKETFTPKKPSGRPGNVAEGGYWYEKEKKHCQGPTIIRCTWLTLQCIELNALNERGSLQSLHFVTTFRSCVKIDVGSRRIARSTPRTRSRALRPTRRKSRTRR